MYFPDKQTNKKEIVFFQISFILKILEKNTIEFFEKNK